MDRRTRRKQLKEIDADEYEDEIWLAYVEPQYENEFSRMIVAQNRSYAPKVDNDKVNRHREAVKKQMDKLNPNTEVPVPKSIYIKKAAIDLVEYDEAREDMRNKNEDVKNLSQPADPVNLDMDAGNDLPAYMYSAAGYRRAPVKTGPRKRHRDYKCNEFVDSSRAIIGSSQEDAVSNGSIKVMNSDEEKNIIKKKPVIRLNERRMLAAEKTLEETEDRVMSTDDEDAVKRRLKARQTKKKKERDESDLTRGLIKAANKGESDFEEDEIPVKKREVSSSI